MNLIKNVKWYVVVIGFLLFSMLSVGSYAYLKDAKTISKMQLSLELSSNQSVRLVQDKTLLEKTSIDYSQIVPLHFNEKTIEKEIYFYNFTGRTGKFEYDRNIKDIYTITIFGKNTYFSSVTNKLKDMINISLSAEKANILPSWLDQDTKVKLKITTTNDFPDAYYNKPLRIGFDVKLLDMKGDPIQFSDGSDSMKDQWIVVQIDKPNR